jgi:hypothetical protein
VSLHNLVIEVTISIIAISSLANLCFVQRYCATTPRAEREVAAWFFFGATMAFPLVFFGIIYLIVDAISRVL